MSKKRNFSRGPDNQVAVLRDIYENFTVTDILSEKNTINVRTDDAKRKIIDVNLENPNVWKAKQSYANDTNITTSIDPETGAISQFDSNSNLIVKIFDGKIQLFKSN